jgi:hypothetical protein
MIVCRDPIFMGEMKHLNQIFFVSIHVNPFSLNPHSCHLKFVHIQQETNFLCGIPYCINNYTVYHN